MKNKLYIVEDARQSPLVAPSDKPVNIVYQNDCQAVSLGFSANVTGLRAGRGTGKTATLAGAMVGAAQSIVRGTLVLYGSSYAQIYGRTMPSLVKEIENTWHWVEGVHFFRGQAPKSAHFPNPLARPKSWSNCIHWYTGAVTQLCSSAVKGSTNGMSIQFFECDETRYVNWDAVSEEVRPAVRAGVYDGGWGWQLSKNPYLCGQWFVSDAAISDNQARWEKTLASEAADCVDINDEIAEMLAELEVAAEEGWYYELYNNPRFRDRLQYLRSKSTNFFNFSTVENLEVLGGEEYIKKQLRQLPPLIFNIQIMNGMKGLSKQDRYYANFSEDVHCYEPNQTLEEDIIKGNFLRKYRSKIDIGGMMKSVDYEAPDLDEISNAQKDCSLDVDCIDGKPLFLSLDTNKNINTFITAQRYSLLGFDSAVILKTMFVLNERRLRSLCADWHLYYAPHQKTCPDVFFFYDSTNKASNYALEEQEKLRFYNVIRDELSKRGWSVYLIDMGQPMDHDLKYQFMNDAFCGALPFMIRINKFNNDFLIASLNTTKNKMTGKLHRKDKSREKLKTKLNEDGLPANQITDCSDAFDNMIIGMRSHMPGMSSSRWGVSDVPVSGVVLG